MKIEDRLTFGDGQVVVTPASVPVVAPVTPVAPTAAKAIPWKAWIPWILLAAVVLVGIGWEVYRSRSQPNPTPGPPPTVDAVTLGKSFAPKLAASLADGFETAATMIAAGTSVKEADEALKAKFQASRWAAYEQFVGPTFNAVVPDGTDPKDAAARAAFAKLHRDFAAGLRGGK